MCNKGKFYHNTAGFGEEIWGKYHYINVTVKKHVKIQGSLINWHALYVTVAF